jgi:hypothetical protein
MDEKGQAPKQQDEEGFGTQGTCNQEGREHESHDSQKDEQARPQPSATGWKVIIFRIRSFHRASLAKLATFFHTLWINDRFVCPYTLLSQGLQLL